MLKSTMLVVENALANLEQSLKVPIWLKCDLVLHHLDIPDLKHILDKFTQLTQFIASIIII